MNKKYLKLSGIIGFLYGLINLGYLILTEKLGYNLIINIVLNVISMIFSIFVYNLSNKDYEYINKKRKLIIISGIYLFCRNIISGILCFFYFRKEGDKDYNIPKITDNISKRDILKSCFCIVLFFIFMYLMPSFKFYKKTSYISYIVIFLTAVIMLFSYLKRDFLIFINNKKDYLKFILKSYLKMLGLVFLVSIPLVLINNKSTSVNQQELTSLFKKMPYLVGLLSVFYAPLIEELIFRFCISKLIKNKKAFIIISGVLFGVLHVITNSSTFNEYLYAVEYITMGVCLASSYQKTNNIFVSIFMHFIQNSLALLVMIGTNFLT